MFVMLWLSTMGILISIGKVNVIFIMYMRCNKLSYETLSNRLSDYFRHFLYQNLKGFARGQMIKLLKYSSDYRDKNKQNDIIT